MKEEERRLVQEVFEIAMHSMKTEELLIQQENMDRYRKNVIEQTEQTAVAMVSYEIDIIRRAEIL